MLALRSELGRKYLPKIGDRWLWQFAGTALAPVAVLVAATPGLAATFAASEGFVQFHNFSHNPYGTDTVVNTGALATIAAPGDSAAAIAAATAVFFSPPWDVPCPFYPLSSAPCLQSSAVNLAGGSGSDYFTAATSQAQVIGNFFVPQGDVFSFDFMAGLNANTSIDNPQGEMATADASLGFLLVDTTDVGQPKIVDYFHLQANLLTPGSDFLQFFHSPDIYLSDANSVYEFGNIELIASYISGYSSHQIGKNTNFTLIEYQANRVTARAPEPSAALGLMLLGIMGVGRRLWRRFFEKPA